MVDKDYTDKLKYIFENAQEKFNFKSFERDLNEVKDIMKNEASYIRPKNNKDSPGGIILLNQDIPTIIVPDLHGRYDFFYKLVNSKINNINVIDALENNELQILCLGDALHTELGTSKRWKHAFNEYADNFAQSEFMDMEINESFSLVNMIINTKIKYPENFHFIKGNHENILNEDNEGNYAFGKYAYEGGMVRFYLKKFWGRDFLYNYSEYEKLMAVFVTGKNFLASHAEPKKYYTRTEIINCYENDKVIYDLTWTADNASIPGTVNLMLQQYLPDCENSKYFAGHKIINDTFNIKHNNFIQIHNPHFYNIAFVYNDKIFEPEKDIIQLS